MAAGALSSFFCPITHELMLDPVVAADGHTYERVAIEQWLQARDTSPNTGAQLQHKILTPNIALRKAIEEWEEVYAMRVRRADVDLEPRPIAAGSFKTVFKGKLRVTVQGEAAREVVVAVLKIRGGECATEASMFLKLGRHPRLVRFMGQCVDGEEQLLLTEFAERGSLSDAFETLEEKITLAHQVIMMQQIAQAMEHLSAEGVLHRDLAARNVLLFGFDEQDVLRTSVKVTDYGLARRMYNNSHVTVAPEHLPARHMSPESLQKSRFSEKSDVWAYGVTCWEILTMGNKPYYDLADREVITHVCAGGKLERAQIHGGGGGGCPDELWELIATCWAMSPKDRPTFSELVLAVGRIKEHQPEGPAMMQAGGGASAAGTPSGPARGSGASQGRKRPRSPRDSQWMANEQDVDAVVSAMQAEVDSAELQAEGCKALSRLAVSNGTPNQENQVKIRRAGGIEAVVDGMKQHAGSAGVQEQGCWALFYLGLNAENRVKIATTGGIEAVVDGMKQHAGSTGVQEQGCKALLILGLNAENQVKIATAGGIEAVVDGMKQHAGSAGVQEFGCGALRNLALNAENKVKIATAGGIEAVVAAMEAHPTSAQVQDWGGKALQKLGVN